MASIVVRRLPAETKERLRQQAARHGRSMEAEARRILGEALAEPNPDKNLAALALRLFGRGHGFEFERVPLSLGREIRFDE